MFVYLLQCSDDATYVGATVNLERRLRQHNNEIKGGAKATTTKVKSGKNWKRICYVSNFPTWNAALQFEWRWKQISRKFPMNIPPLERRLQALDKLLSLEKPTTKAISFSEWESPPTIHIENEEVICSMYLQHDNSNYKIGV